MRCHQRGEQGLDALLYLVNRPDLLDGQPVRGRKVPVEVALAKEDRKRRRSPG